MDRFEQQEAKIERARARHAAAVSALNRADQDYEALCQKTEKLVEQSGTGQRLNRTLTYKGRKVHVVCNRYSWVIVRADGKREHFDSLRAIRIGIVRGKIAI